MKYIRIIRSMADAFRKAFPGLLCGTALLMLSAATAHAQVQVDEIYYDGDYEATLSGGTMTILVCLDADITGFSGWPYIDLKNISSLAGDTTEHRAYLVRCEGDTLFFEYNIQAGDFSSGVDVNGSITIPSDASIMTKNGSVKTGTFVPSLIDDAGYAIQIQTVLIEGVVSTVDVPTGKAKASRELSFRIISRGLALPSTVSFSVSVESNDDVAFLASDQTGAKGRISSDYGETFSTTMGVSGVIALIPLIATDEDATIRIHPTAMSGNGADLTIIYHGVAENVASIEKIRVLSNDDETYGADETIRLDVKFDDGISSVSGTPVLRLNVQNQNNNSAYTANSAFANYAVYNATLSSGEYMVFDYIVKPGDFVGHLDATDMNFGSGSGRINFDTGASLDWNFPTGSDTRSLASNSSVGIRTITFQDYGSAKANISIEEGYSTTLTVTRGGAASRVQSFTVSSFDPDTGNAMRSGDVISYPAFFSIPAGAESASLDIAAQWAGTQCLRLHPYGYSGTDGDLVATVTVTPSSIPPQVMISGPSSANAGYNSFPLDISLSKAPKETITVTVSLSNTSCLKISNVDRSVGRINASNAVIRFEAGQTGPYSVTLDPLDGNATVTLTATADKTYTSASHNIMVRNVAPWAQVSPLNDDGEWVISGFLAMFEGIISWQVLDSAADLSAGVRYSIDWGDGSSDSGVCNSYGYARHTYESARGDPEEGYGGYWITLALTDKNGGRSTMSGRIIVEQPLIRLNAAGGTFINSKGESVEDDGVYRSFGSRYGELPIPKMRGYSFKGWEYYDSETGETGIVSASTIVKEGHYAYGLHAVWYENVIPSVEDIIETAIDNAGFADAEGVKAAIGGDFAKYAEFREWAQGVEGGETAVVASPNAAASFQLGAETLFDSAPVITFEDVSIAGEDAGVPAMTVTVAVHDGDDIAAVAAEKVAEMFEATSSLGDWDGDAKLTPTVSGITRNADGTMTFTVVPGDGSAKSAFLRIRAN